MKSIKFKHILIFTSTVAVPPLFWAARAPEVRGPRVGSGSRKKKAAPDGSGAIHKLKFLICALKKLTINTSPFLDHIYLYKLLFSSCLTQCFGSGSEWILVFSPIWIRVLKVRIRIRPLINLWDLNDGTGIDKVFEEPDQKEHC